MRYFHLNDSGGPTACHCCSSCSSEGTFRVVANYLYTPRDSFLDPGYSTSMGKYVEYLPHFGWDIMAIPYKKQHHAVATKQQVCQQQAVATDFWIQLVSQSSLRTYHLLVVSNHPACCANYVTI